jgi:hypothetical protein
MQKLITNQAIMQWQEFLFTRKLAVYPTPYPFPCRQGKGVRDRLCDSVVCIILDI